MFYTQYTKTNNIDVITDRRLRSLYTFAPTSKSLASLAIFNYMLSKTQILIQTSKHTYTSYHSYYTTNTKKKKIFQ